MPLRARCVLFSVPLKPAGDLILAEMDDGTLQILKDGEPVKRCRWVGADMALAITAFQKLKARHVAEPPADPDCCHQ